MRSRGQHFASSLEDSSYEILDGFEHTSEDDDGTTASLSGASDGGRTPDDLLSLAGTDHSVDEADEEAKLKAPVQFEVARSTGAVRVSPEKVGEARNSDDESETDEEEDSHMVESILSQPSTDYEHIEDSSMTARPLSPLAEPEMSPSIRLDDRAESQEAPGREPGLTAFEEPAKSYADAFRCLLARHDIVKRTMRILSIQVVLACVAAIVAYALLPTISTSWEVVRHPSIHPREPAMSNVSNMPPAVVPEGSSQKPMDPVATRAMTDIAKVVRADTSLTVSGDTEETVKADKFGAQIMDNSHVIITAPRSFRQLKKVPELSVGVMRRATSARKTQVIASSVTITDRVYVVSIDRQEAHGELTVVIWAKKPKVEQSFTLDFGSSWLQLSRYSAMANRVSAAALEEFQSATLQGSQRLSGLTKDGLKTLERSREHAADLAAKVSDAANKLASQSVIANPASLGEVSKAVGKAITSAEKEIIKAVNTVQDLGKHVRPSKCMDSHLKSIAGVVKRAQHNAKSLSKRFTEQKRAARTERKCAHAAKKAQRLAEKEAKRGLRNQKKVAHERNRSWPKRENRVV